VRLIQFTDLHLSPEQSGRVRGVDTRDSFRRCLAHARRHAGPADALLLTGDLAQDDVRSYHALVEILAGETTPVHCLPGNHDLPDQMARVLGVAPFDLSPVLRYGDWTIVLLDSAIPGIHHGELRGNSLAFLDEVLARFADTHALVVLHHQPVPVGSAWLDTIGLVDAGALLEVVSRHRNVRGLLWGHVHQAFDAVRDGVLLMATPSTCFQFVPQRDDYAVDDRPPGYRRLDLHPDGRIDTEVHWVGEEC
jgi:3',5'-cyclic-AMP phosphodiesterase